MDDKLTCVPACFNDVSFLLGFYSFRPYLAAVAMIFKRPPVQCLVVILIHMSPELQPHLLISVSGILDPPKFALTLSRRAEPTQLHGQGLL